VSFPSHAMYVVFVPQPPGHAMPSFEVHAYFAWSEAPVAQHTSVTTLQLDVVGQTMGLTCASGAASPPSGPTNVSVEQPTRPQTKTPSPSKPRTMPTFQG